MFQKGLHACLLYLLHRSSVVSSRPDPRLDDTPLLFPRRQQRHGDVIHIPSNSRFSVVFLSEIHECPGIGQTIVVLARSGLVSLPQEYCFLSNACLPTYNAYKLPSPDSRFGRNRALTDACTKSILSTVDKFTYKWPKIFLVDTSCTEYERFLDSSYAGTERGWGLEPRQHGGNFTRRSKLRDTRGWNGHWTQNGGKTEGSKVLKTSDNSPQFVVID